MSDAEASTMLSALSVLLAAYGFFFTSTTDMFKSLEVPQAEVATQSRLERTQDLARLKKARTPAYTLAAGPSLVVILFANVFVDIVGNIDVSGTYSPLKAALAALVGFWLGLAITMWYRVVRLRQRISSLQLLLRL